MLGPRSRRFIITLCAGTLFATGLMGQVKIDPDLPKYQARPGVSGKVKSIGSDTMSNLMSLWAEEFKRHYPAVRVEIEGKGSSTASAALIAGTATLGPMSRKMKRQEVDAFKKKYGYVPTQLPVAIDMLAVYVHRDNPIVKRGLTLAELDAIFSKNRRRGYAKELRTWGDVGLEGAWRDRPISLYGRNSASGTYGFFKVKALGNGDFKDSVKEQPGSSSVVQGVASDLYGIGYSGIGYETADVATVPLRANERDGFVPATAEMVYTQKYPLWRFLWLGLNVKPGRRSEMDPLRREFLELIYSRVGQRAVLKDGYYPVTATVRINALKKAGLIKSVRRKRKQKDR
jgi:phosphate transport system substrate-binding protein